MSIAAVGSSSTDQTAEISAQFKQRRLDFQALSKALKSNDLAGAQKAFAALQQDAPTNANNPLSSDIASLGSALQSGDLAGAQKAYATLQQDAQKLHGQHHHHHHGQGAATATTENNTPSNTNGTFQTTA